MLWCRFRLDPVPGHVGCGEALGQDQASTLGHPASCAVLGETDPYR